VSHIDIGDKGTVEAACENLYGTIAKSGRIHIVTDSGTIDVHRNADNYEVSYGFRDQRHEVSPISIKGTHFSYSKKDGLQIL
jgi:hypothetical protein